MSFSGSPVHSVMSFSGSPLHDNHDTIEGAVVVFRDVTTSQKLERAKDDFLAVAAHELRSPLAAVRGYAELLVRREQRRGEEDSPELRGLNILSQQVTHMLRMVDSLLDITRLDAGQFNLSFQRINLVLLTEQVIEQLRPAAGDRDVGLETDRQDLLVVCDPQRIWQVLTNLISNAIRYSPSATTVSVGLTCEWASRLAKHHPAFASIWAAQHDPLDEDQLMALAWVRDQGTGISSEQAERLFKRYARGQERRGEGLGLGLYLSREFVTRHGGTIWVEGQENQGSTFFVALPLEQPDNDETAP
jgi:two-component system phosphate regulon sensor histidine kinase PhoR